MLEVFAKIICASMMSLAGFYIIDKITEKNVSIKDIKVLAIIFIMSLLVVATGIIKDSSLYTIIIFFINIMSYKLIFNLTIEESTISTGILMFLVYISEIIISIIFMILFVADDIMNSNIILIIINFFIMMLNIILVNIEKIKRPLSKFYFAITNDKSKSSIVFIMLLIIEASYLTYSLATDFSWNITSITNVLIMIIMIVITIIFVINKNSYTKLSSEYDSLFSYIKNFEEWIEKEQLNRHEYKNQLAVLRCLTKDKKTKNKIDEILEENINVEGETIHELKDLPKGGLKGLMYYKTIIAQKNKLKLTFNVSIDKKSIINKLSEKEMNILCKLIGIYFDNAIEAASETRKKNILVEVYDLKEKTNIVISNTFKNSSLFEKRNEKGVSTKGRGRGNGLHFAKNILSKNDWIEEKQELVDGYYIQKLIIKKLEK